MIVNYASSIINKLEALLTGDTRVVIYDCLVFIVQATELVFHNFIWHNENGILSELVAA